MAFGGISLNVYSSNGRSVMSVSSASATFQNVLDVLKTGQGTGGVALAIGESYGTGQEIGLSLTEGGSPLTLSSLVTSVFPEDSGGILYALYPGSAETITGFYLDGTEYKFEGGGTSSEQNLFIITEDMVTVSTSEDTGVAPYNTSYKYTNFDIDANAGIEWKEGAIYTFVVDTKMVVASAYRNVRVRIGDGAYIPVMATTAAASGSSYFIKTAIRQFQYTTKYESGGGLHVFTDSNTTYKAMTEAQATAGTATTALTISPSILKGAITTHALAKNNTTAFTPTGDYQPATKKYVDDTTSSVASGKVSDTAYASSWDGVTNIAPSKNAVYDKLNAMDTTIAGKQDTLNTQTAYSAMGSATKVPQITTNTLGQVTNITEVDIEGGETYHAGEGISIGEQQANARKGPSPDGFHVPSKTEWEGIRTIMQGLSLHTGPGWRINLHIPLAGYRTFSSGGITTQGSTGYYWSSSNSGADNPNYARSMYLNSSNAVASYSIARAFGLSIRCFKDSFEKPTSSRTVIQGTLGGAGIFRNQTDGLISITSDGTTGYTMQDKNLGATTVYNDGDTLSEANCGKYYQWGNNYGFAGIGGSEPRKSSTKVDTSTYGPTNPYSSDTFIVGGEGWSSGYNGDLRGDTTGTITIKNVITNTGVLSVNGQTGNVIVQSGSEASGVTTTQPSNPVAGSTYYDTTSLAVKVYDGTQWNELGSGGGGGGLGLEYMSKVTLNGSGDGEHWLNTGVGSLAYDAYVVCLTNSTCRFILGVELGDYNYPRAATNDIKNGIMQVSGDSKWLRAGEKLFIYDYYGSGAVYNFYIYKFTRPS